ncbi:YjfK family protein [Vibrio parahaemolyticus]|uniref:YjfK family protein n=1 Tax=Vibrio parahaemolyticus TaxID=670 RepID=UPI0023EE0B67|nr:YjfK family protein [Vibrio parahaemolyticus]
MLRKLAAAFRAIFAGKAPAVQKTETPEVLGLRLGGVVELDKLKLTLIEEKLTIEDAAVTQHIEAVGVVPLEGDTRLVRYYTDDDGFIQVLQEGEGEAGVLEVSLWYFYDSKPIDTQELWDKVIEEQIVTPDRKYDLDGTEFVQHWENEKPVCMTETTYTKSGKKSETDQFVMVYSREIAGGLTEELLIAGEEKQIGNKLDRLVARSTGVQLKQTDFKAVA